MAEWEQEVEQITKSFVTPKTNFGSYKTIKVVPTAETKLDLSRQFIDSLRTAQAPIVFEIISSTTIYFQFSCLPTDEADITRQLKIYFPDFEITSIAFDRVYPPKPKAQQLNIFAFDDPLGYPMPDFLTSTNDILGSPLSADFFDDPLKALNKSSIQQPKQLYTQESYFQSNIGFLRAITSGDIDNYYLLTNLLDSIGADQFVIIQFVFFPISFQDIGFLNKRLDELPEKQSYMLESRTELTFDKYYQEENKSIPSYNKLEVISKSELGSFPDGTLTRYEHQRYIGIIYETDPRLKQQIKDYQAALTRKQPPWLFSVRLFASQKQILDQIRANFLNRFISSSQAWYTSVTTTTKTTTPLVNNWSLVASDELLSFVHFPVSPIALDRLEAQAAIKPIEPPELYLKDGVVLGTLTIKNEVKTVRLPNQSRNRHLYLIGKSRSGKSTIMFNCVRQDIEQGKSAVIVVDPHGDLVEQLLHHIPQNRIKDTIYFDASDLSNPIGLSIMVAKDPKEAADLASDLLLTFRRLSDTWGERMDSLLRYTLHTLLSVPNTSFIDIQTILQDEPFRKRIIAQLKSQQLIDFWQNQFPQYPDNAIQPILNRMTKFLLSPHLYAILGQKANMIDFHDVLENKKVLLVNISKGKITSDASTLLGALIVSLIQIYALRRQHLPQQKRHQITLAVDEFQNFMSSAFETILSEAGKFNLCLCIAHQFISQLNDETRHAIFGNVGTFCVFQLGSKDAHYLQSELGQFTPKDITNLLVTNTVREVICKPSTRSSETFKFCSLPVPPVTKSYAQEIIEHTRKTYGSLQIPTPPPSQPTPTQAPAPPQAVATPLPTKQPAALLPKSFANAQDKILFYLGRYEYLSYDQIIELCFSHLAPTSRKPSASRALQKLVDDKKAKEQPFLKSKVYYQGRTCNPTEHNLSIRDLLIKIEKLNFEIVRVSFFENFGNLISDLAVDFLATDGSFIKTLWEYDAGTEGVQVLVSKMNRYQQFASDSIITFVFDSQSRLNQMRPHLTAGFLYLDALPTFATVPTFLFTP